MIKIRKAVKNDMEEVLELLHELPQIMGRIDFFGVPLKNYEKKHRAYLMQAFRKDIFLVAEKDDKIVGVAMLKFSKRIPILKIQKVGRVSEVFVHKDYRRQGIGTQLLRAAQKYFKSKGMDYLEIMAYKRNKPAIGAYKKFGFEEFKTIMRKKI